MAIGKIRQTKDYGMFTRSEDNRPTDIKKHKRLMLSMEQYGFISSFPIVCRRERGKLVVKDGQHRLVIAQSLGKPVFWIEEAVDFDIARVNCTPLGWNLRDYAKKYARNGLKAYQEGLDFAEKHGMPLGTAFALLAGTTNFCCCKEAYMNGDFKVKDRAWADSVAGVYGPMVLLSSALDNNMFLLSCMAICRVPNFDAVRLISAANRCRGKLIAYANREDYLTALEAIYNYDRSAKNLVALKIEAERAMRERNIGKPKAAKDKVKVVA